MHSNEQVLRAMAFVRARSIHWCAQHKGAAAAGATLAVSFMCSAAALPFGQVPLAELSKLSACVISVKRTNSSLHLEVYVSLCLCLFVDEFCIGHFRTRCLERVVAVFATKIRLTNQTKPFKSSISNNNNTNNNSNGGAEANINRSIVLNWTALSNAKRPSRRFAPR